MSPPLKSEHTAISTWSGFVYQGKIATYHSLKSIYESGGSADNHLQLDYFEDFAILDSSGNAVSLHQVKALKSKSYGSYSKAFDQLKAKASKHKGAPAFFHLAQSINNQTVSEIEKLHSPIKIYLYDNVSCAALKDIDYLIEEIIKKIYLQSQPHLAFKVAPEYLKASRALVDQLILRKIIVIHAAVHASTLTEKEAARTQTIPLLKFKNLLSADLNTASTSKEYYLYLLKQDLYRYHELFCYETQNCTPAELEKISNCLLKIAQLDGPSSIKFIRHLLPDREFKFETLTDYKDNTLTQDGVKDSFLKILRTLKEPEFDSEKFFRWKVNADTFTPTTIFHGSSHKETICERIIKNALETDLDLMFEESTLITSDIETRSICAEAPEIIDSEMYDPEKSKIITKWKNISLITIEKAKGIIND